MKILILLILSFLTLFAQDQSVYTLTGQKDPRLDARYSITYVATNLKEGCGSRGYTTGTMKPSMTQRSMSVPDGNYTINLPIYMTPEEDKEGCGYRFGGLELTIKRKNDDLYSKFQLLGDYGNQDPITGKEEGGQKARVIYLGWKGGMGGFLLGVPDNQAPIYFRSNKKYFCIAPETTFACVTNHVEGVYEKDSHTNFVCTMQMQLDTEGGKYHYKECTVPPPSGSVDCFTTTNPEFGVDEIKRDTLHIDIIVDESKCHQWSSRGKEPDIFREVRKPSSAIETLKSLF